MDNSHDAISIWSKDDLLIESFNSATIFFAMLLIEAHQNIALIANCGET